MSYKIIILYISLVSVQNIFAQISEFNEKRYQYRGTRALGMGGTQVSTVNDETALFINPANLLRLRGAIASVIDIEIESSSNIYTPLYQTTAFSPMSSNSVFQSLSSNPGENYYFRTTTAPSFVTPYFGLSLLSNQILNMEFNSDTNKTQLFYRDDQGLFTGFAIRLFSGILKIGFTGKIISRNEADALITLPDDVNVNNFITSGSAIGIDSGITITLPVIYLPTISLVVRDIGNTKFTSNIFTRKTTAQKPKDDEQSIDIGFSLNPISKNNTRSTWSIDLHQLNRINSSPRQIDHLHLGYEFNYHDIFFSRFGFNQSYWTAGIEIASERTQFQISTHGEEVGGTGSTKESRRLAFKWSFRL